MTKPVNLNQFKKQKARAAKKARAAENVVKHGRTKAQKAADQAQIVRRNRLTDGHKTEN